MTTPPAPAADDKDWTWVLERLCPECGYDAATVARAAVPDRTRAAVGEFVAALARPDSATRPAPEVWSPLEYACHVRDVCIVFGTRLALMVGTSDPLFPNWDQDETALAERYWEQDPAKVSDELAVEGERIAAALAAVAGEQWERPGRRSNGSTFTVDSLARYFLHDLEHHRHDIAR